MTAQTAYDYIKSPDEVKNQRTVYTEIDINASPEIVREKFLEFDKWSEWCKVIPQISVASGDIYKLETKPKLDLTLDFGQKNDPAKSPASPRLTVNSPKVLVWGLYSGFILKAEHVFVFQPIDGGKGTHLIHYERMTGLLSPLLLTKKVSVNMKKHYNIMNEDLKSICEN